MTKFKTAESVLLTHQSYCSLSLSCRSIKTVWILTMGRSWPTQRALFQYKDHLSRYGYFHYKDKTVVRPSYLYKGNSYTGKTGSLYRRPTGPGLKKSHLKCVHMMLLLWPHKVLHQLKTKQIESISTRLPKELSNDRLPQEIITDVRPPCDCSCKVSRS